MAAIQETLPRGDVRVRLAEAEKRALASKSPEIMALMKRRETGERIDILVPGYTQERDGRVRDAYGGGRHYFFVDRSPEAGEPLVLAEWVGKERVFHVDSQDSIAIVDAGMPETKVQLTTAFIRIADEQRSALVVDAGEPVGVQAESDVPSDVDSIRDRVYALRPPVTKVGAPTEPREVDLRVRIPVTYEIQEGKGSSREAVITDPVSGEQRFSVHFELGSRPPQISRVHGEDTYIVEQNGNGQGYTIDTRDSEGPVNLELAMSVAKVHLGSDTQVISYGHIGYLDGDGENNVVVLQNGAKVVTNEAGVNCTIINSTEAVSVKPDPAEVAADGALTEEEKQAAIDRAREWQEAEAERQRIVNEQYYNDDGIYLWQDLDADKLRKGWKTNIVSDITEEGQRTVTLQGPELALLAVKAGTKVHAKDVSLINRVNVVDGILSAKRVQQLFVQGTEERESTARISVAVDEVKVAANASVLTNRLLKEGYVSADGNLVVRHLDGKVVVRGEEGHEANVVVTEPRDDNFVDLRGDARLYMQTGYFIVSGERNFINDQLVGPGSYVITDGKIQPQNQIREGGQVMQEVVPLPGLILKQSSGKVLPLAEVMPPVLKEKEDEMVALKGRLVKLTGEEILSSLSIPDHVGVDASGIPGIEYVHVQTGGSLHRAKHIDQGIIEGWLTGVASAGSLEVVGGRAKVGALRGDTIASEGSELTVEKLYGLVVAEGSKEKPTYVSINNMRGEGVVVLKGTLNTRIEEGYVVVVGNDVTTYGLSGQVRRKTIAPGIYEVHKGEFVPVEEPTKLAEIREKTARYIVDSIPDEVVDGDATVVESVSTEPVESSVNGDPADWREQTRGLNMTGAPYHHVITKGALEVLAGQGHSPQQLGDIVREAIRNGWALTPEVAALIVPVSVTEPSATAPAEAVVPVIPAERSTDVTRVSERTRRPARQQPVFVYNLPGDAAYMRHDSATNRWVPRVLPVEETHPGSIGEQWDRIIGEDQRRRRGY